MRTKIRPGCGKIRHPGRGVFLCFLGQRDERIILLGVAASIHAGAHEGHTVTQIERVVLQQDHSLL